jgi:uracil-DNA glycosylase family 4
MKNNILNKIENYLNHRKDVFGEDIYIEKDKLFVPEKEIDVSESESDYKGTVNKDWQKSKSLEDLYSDIHNCKECELGKTRNKFVFGSGNPNADIMIIGEAPGKDEDLQGEPFVGRAGQLLTKILEAINLSRDDVFIANIIKCRPPGNRVPQNEEVEKCEPYLKKQIELINPKFILSLGLTSVQTLLKQKFKMADIRGQHLEYHGITLLVTYHPAALLRNPNWKKATWEDVKYLRKLYDDYLEKQKVK